MTNKVAEFTLPYLIDCAPRGSPIGVRRYITADSQIIDASWKKFDVFKSSEQPSDPIFQALDAHRSSLYRRVLFGFCQKWKDNYQIEAGWRPGHHFRQDESAPNGWKIGSEGWSEDSNTSNFFQLASIICESAVMALMRT